MDINKINNMDKKIRFKVPRKDKKRIKKSLMLFYPRDEKGNSLMADPLSKQKDYTAFKKGELRNLLGTKKEQEERRKERSRILNKETVFTEDQLRKAVDEVFAEQYRDESYRSLLRAFNSTNKKKYYYHFVNAYLEGKKGNRSYFNTCCMTVDFINDVKY